MKTAGTTRREGLGRDAAEAMLPVLLGRIDDASRRMGALHARVERDPEVALTAAVSAELTETGRMLDDLGWLVGLLARGLSADILGERRERDGLAALLSLLSDTLQRAGAPLAPPAAPLPRIGTATACGPDASWAVAAVLWRASDALARRSPATAAVRAGMSWALEPSDAGFALRVDGRAGARVRELGGEIEAWIAGARFEDRADGWRLFFPRGAFEAA